MVGLDDPEGLDDPKGLFQPNDSMKIQMTTVRLFYDFAL